MRMWFSATVVRRFPFGARSPTAGYYADPGRYEPAPCRIGRNAVLRSHAVVYAGVEIGDGFSCGHRVTIREGSRIGRGCRIGTDCDLQGHLTIGSHTRMHSGVFVPQHTTVEKLVWIFPRTVLLNDPHPPSDTCTRGPTLRAFSVVGAPARSSPASRSVEGRLSGAGSVVRSDVPADAVVVGVPARVVGTTADIVCREGRLERVYPWWRHFRRGYPGGRAPSGGRLASARRASLAPTKLSGAVTATVPTTTTIRGADTAPT